MAQLIVAHARIRVGQYGIGLIQFRHIGIVFFRCASGAVRMIALRQSTVSGLDDYILRLRQDAEDGVVIAIGIHPHTPA